MIDQGNRLLHASLAPVRRWALPVVAGIGLAITTAQASYQAPAVLMEDSFLNAVELAWGLDPRAPGLQYADWSTTDQSGPDARAQLAAMHLEATIFQARFEPQAPAPRAAPGKLDAAAGVTSPSDAQPAADGIFRRLVTIGLGLGLIVLAAANSRKRRPTFQSRSAP